MAIAAIACVSLWRAYRGDGSFARDSSMAKVESMQLFWILLAVPLMPLAAMVQQHKFASRALAESDNRFTQLFDQASVGVALESLAGKLRSGEPAVLRVVGLYE